MPTIKGVIAHSSGIPLGGLGTGSVEIRPDGYFHEWQIFNLGEWAPRQPECCRVPSPDMGPGALAFFVRAERVGKLPICRRLGVRADQHDLYSLAWLRSVQGVDFDGRYPVARLRYLDDELPVSLSAEMFSPFVPHDSRTSGTPGCFIVFTVKNLSGERVAISLLGTLKNPLAWGAKDRALANSVSQEEGATLITMRTSAAMECAATVGSMCLSVTGGEASWISGEHGLYMQGYTSYESAYARSHECFLHSFRETGRLPSLAADRAPSPRLRMSDEEIGRLSDEQRDSLMEEALKHPFAHALAKRVAEAEARLLLSDEGKRVFLTEVRKRLERFAWEHPQGWGDIALCSQVALAPGEQREVVFAVSWFFPNHYNASGQLLGHQYENWFADAEDASRFLVRRCGEVAGKVRGFSDVLQRTTLPGEFADAWSAQLTTLPKSTWWSKNGDFGVWEGLGCCGLHTTDITYQGSFGLLALFPDLQKRQMEMGARFQREDGRVHHLFHPDFSAVDNDFGRVDMNQQFVLLVCRDYLWTGDKEYLAQMWPHILKAMESTAELDADGDGLPDHDTRLNTYDQWNFYGTPSYIASLWLSALLAGARMADEMGDAARAKQWRATLARGRASFDRKLWNGEYYSLWVDGVERDECCMSDQIDGEWFTQLIGLGHCLPRQRVRAALRSVNRYNYREEDGLINATYPPGRQPRLSTYRNFQANAPWTGIEYAVASMMMEFGLVREAGMVVRNIHRRYLWAGRFWNHVECGDHYYRAMSSWAMLLSATGFKLDVPRQAVTFSPTMRKAVVAAPWVSPTGWGHFAQHPTHFEMECAAGEIAFRELRLKRPIRPGRVTLNDEQVSGEITTRQGLTVVALAETVVLRAGDRLMVFAH